MPPLIALITVALLAAPAPASTSCRGPLTREAVVAARRVGLWNNGQTDTNIYGRLAQEIEIAGQRRKRMAVADTEWAQAQIELTERDIAAAALTAYFEAALAAQKQRAKIARIAGSAETLVELARSSERAGLGSVLTADVSMVASLRVRRQQIEAERRVTSVGAVQRPLATVVIGGLISASILTLLVLPAVYARFGPRTATPAS